MFRASLFWKIFGSFLILIVLTALVGGWVASRVVISDIEHETDTTLRNHLELIHELFADSLSGGPNDALQLRVRTIGENTGTRITLIDASGRVIADSSKDPEGMDDHASRPEVVEAKDEPVGRSQRLSDTLGMQMVYMARAVRDEGDLRGFVRGAIPLVQYESRLATLRLAVLGAAAFAVLIGLIGALIAARMLARPLQSMRNAATAIAAGDYERRVQTTTSDEVGDLGRAFNEMAVQLETDITNIRRDQREMKAILGGMVEGVLAVDGKERIALVNDAACKILGLDAEHVRDRPIWEALRLPQVPDTMRLALKRGETQSAILTLSADGRDRTVRMHVSPLLGEGGEARGAVLVLDDITERRRLEEVRRDFVANASHELKTPVASIRGMAETVLDDRSMEDETRRGFMDRILRQSHRLGDLIEEMLALSRLESETEGFAGRTLNMGHAVREVVDDMAVHARESDVSIETQFEGDELMVKAEGEAVRRITGNLLDNAIKYTPQGGSVFVRLRRDEEHIVLEVEDTGPGIPADKQDRVFERFYRVDEGRARGAGGTGLGLAIVKHLVQMLRGRIELECPPGQGSTFRVALPRA